MIIVRFGKYLCVFGVFGAFWSFYGQGRERTTRKKSRSRKVHKSSGYALTLIKPIDPQPLIMRIDPLSFLEGNES